MAAKAIVSHTEKKDGHSQLAQLSYVDIPKPTASSGVSPRLVSDEVASRPKEQSVDCLIELLNPRRVEGLPDLLELPGDWP